jgi:hypothetical protein
MIPKYVLEGMDEGTSVVYGSFDEKSLQNKGRIQFYAGTFSRIISESGKIAIHPTDSRVDSELETLDSHTDFLFGMSTIFEQRPWVNNMRTLLRTSLVGEDQRSVPLLRAVENILDRFPTICRSRKEYFAERDSTLEQV